MILIYRLISLVLVINVSLVSPALVFAQVNEDGSPVYSTPYSYPTPAYVTPGNYSDYADDPGYSYPTPYDTPYSYPTPDVYSPDPDSLGWDSPSVPEAETESPDIPLEEAPSGSPGINPTQELPEDDTSDRRSDVDREADQNSQTDSSNNQGSSEDNFNNAFNEGFNSVYNGENLTCTTSACQAGKDAAAASIQREAERAAFEADRRGERAGSNTSAREAEQGGDSGGFNPFAAITGWIGDRFSDLGSGASETVGGVGVLVADSAPGQVVTEALESAQNVASSVPPPDFPQNPLDQAAIIIGALRLPSGTPPSQVIPEAGAELGPLGVDVSGNVSLFGITVRPGPQERTGPIRPGTPSLREKDPNSIEDAGKGFAIFILEDLIPTSPGTNIKNLQLLTNSREKLEHLEAEVAAFTPTQKFVTTGLTIDEQLKLANMPDIEVERLARAKVRDMVQKGLFNPATTAEEGNMVTEVYQGLLTSRDTEIESRFLYNTANQARFDVIANGGLEMIAGPVVDVVRGAVVRSVQDALPDRGAVGFLDGFINRPAAPAPLTSAADDFIFVGGVQRQPAVTTLDGRLDLFPTLIPPSSIPAPLELAGRVGNNLNDRLVQRADAPPTLYQYQTRVGGELTPEVQERVMRAIEEGNYTDEQLNQIGFSSIYVHQDGSIGISLDDTVVLNPQSREDVLRGLREKMGRTLEVEDFDRSVTTQRPIIPFNSQSEEVRIAALDYIRALGGPINDGDVLTPNLAADYANRGINPELVDQATRQVDNFFRCANSQCGPESPYYQDYLTVSNSAFFEGLQGGDRLQALAAGDSHFYTERLSLIDATVQQKTNAEQILPTINQVRRDFDILRDHAIANGAPNADRLRGLDLDPLTDPNNFHTYPSARNTQGAQAEHFSESGVTALPPGEFGNEFICYHEICHGAQFLHNPNYFNELAVDFNPSESSRLYEGVTHFNTTRAAELSGASEEIIASNVTPIYTREVEMIKAIKNDIATNLGISDTEAEAIILETGLLGNYNDLIIAAGGADIIRKRLQEFFPELYGTPNSGQVQGISIGTEIEPLLIHPGSIEIAKALAEEILAPSLENGGVGIDGKYFENLVRQEFLARKIAVSGSTDSDEIKSLLVTDMVRPEVKKTASGYIFTTGKIGNVEGEVKNGRYEVHIDPIRDVDFKVGGYINATSATDRLIVPIAVTAGSGVVDLVGEQPPSYPLGSLGGTTKVEFALFADANENGKMDEGEKILPWAGLDIILREKYQDSTINLLNGWNLVALTASPTSPMTALDLIARINEQGGEATAVSKLVDGEWQTVAVREGQVFSGVDFPIEVGVGYFVKSAKFSLFVFKGNRVSSPIPLGLKEGWNSVGFPFTSRPYDALNVLSNLNQNGGFPESIAAFDSGFWDTFLVKDNQNFGNNFAIIPTRGYILKVGREVEISP